MPLWRCIVVATFVCYTTSANAQFGAKCDSPTSDSSLAAATLTDAMRAAIRATCIFNAKALEIRLTYGKPGWSWDLLPKARSDVSELTVLADQAAALNFSTNDPKALGNIRHMFIHVGNQQRWLSDQERTFAMRQRRLSAAPQPGANAPVDAAGAGPMFVSVIFQDDIPDADRTAFLQAYSVSIADRPDADRSYRLRLGARLPQDQLRMVLESMNSQTKVVKIAFVK